jgi:hypothetical protein
MSSKEILKEQLTNLAKSKKGSSVKDQILNTKDESKREAVLRRLEKMRRKA